MAETGTGNRGSGDGVRPAERQRIKKLAQAALNADVTVDQVEAILTDLGDVLVDMNKTIGGLDGAIDTLDGTLSRLSGTLDQVDSTVVTMGDVVDRLERVVSRVEILVGIGEAALRPLGALESAGRGVAARLGLLR
ncbi:hypothetical protein GTV32_08430 [Gordonia sp. SID5947]|uniref:hypothetical protein n=1 Tax=Gordonia sp. SID5947 TaxID=2690315 RepID=UPI00136C2437|nr:hypothetical protein [Gordonia sp. SID5947]MYR06341.1 hypothetical protein [Gordonia sp. SID5947]